MNKSRIKRVFYRIVSFGCALLLLLPLAGCSDAIDSPVLNRTMTIGEIHISYDLLRYFVMNSIYNSENIDPDTLADDPDMQAELEDNVYDMLRLLAAYVSLAEDYDISVSSRKKSEIKDSIKQSKKNVGKEAFNAELRANYLTEDVLYQLSLIEELKSGVYDYLINEYTSPIRSDDDTIRQDIANGNWFCAEYIGLTFQSDSGDGKRAELAQEICGRAKAGESMSKLASEYQKIYGLGEVAYMYLGGFTYGQKIQCFEDTILSLEIGEYSEVCDFPKGGYYIAHRLPLDDDYIDANFNSEIRAAYLNREIEKIATARAAELEIKLRDKYADYEFWTMK